jgi:hypothetical protein
MSLVFVPQHTYFFLLTEGNLKLVSLEWPLMICYSNQVSSQSGRRLDTWKREYRRIHREHNALVRLPFKRRNYAKIIHILSWTFLTILTCAFLFPDYGIFCFPLTLQNRREWFSGVGMTYGIINHIANCIYILCM